MYGLFYECEFLTIGRKKKKKKKKLHRVFNIFLQVYQYFIIYRQYFFFLQNLKFFNEYLIQHSLKSGGTKDHFRWVKVPGTDPY